MTTRSNNRILTTGLAALLAFCAASPASADDTELLLVNPDPGLAPTPNVMFILDTSGSMTTQEETLEPYDSAQSYTGSCDTDNLYWSDVGIEPDCASGTQDFIQKTAFKCAAAGRQLTGIGSYTNTMAQFRADLLGLTSSWQSLAPGNSTDFVECQADSGTHGDGTADEVYASAQPDISGPWSADPLQEVSWGSSPRNVSYTVYDGNYLNWKNSANTVTLSRNEIMRSVTKTVLSSVDNMNVGIMRFNNSDGGAVIQGITDLDANRAQILSVVDGLNASGATPLAETMYEAALYWGGQPAYYGENITEHTTDPDALAATAPNVYQQPSLDVCAKNYNVLLTDGQPNQDIEGPDVVPTLPAYATALGRTGCSDTGEGACLTDVTEYLFKHDMNTTLDGAQNVTTHTIGFTIDLPILRNAALASEGQYFMADDVESLTLALLQIVANISDRAVSFAAPAVSVNTFNRTQNLNQLYLTVFSARSKVHWPGNLKRYGIANGTIVDADGEAAVDPATGFFYDGARSFWTIGDDGNDVRKGGAANQLPNPTLRNLFTNNGNVVLTAASNQLTPSNADAFTNADFGLTGASGEPTREELIRWARGEDVRDEDNNPATTVRNVMGDPLHSQPAAVVYGGSAASPDVVVFTATNDGYLHAINGSTGAELWSFIPKELLPRMERLYFDPAAKYKDYGIDGDVVPVVRDANNNGVIDTASGDFVYLIFGLRRGGSGYYALDVTDKTAPRLLWHVDQAEFGQSWSTPVVARMNINDGALNANKA
ncbi:MAG TPA: hypothetical protein VFE85_04985, partial [Woeseiaceae bacterium]|nr:hypothetical protein [Woeseiaceae bacterium]